MVDRMFGREEKWREPKVVCRGVCLAIGTCAQPPDRSHRYKFGTSVSHIVQKKVSGSTAEIIPTRRIAHSARANPDHSPESWGSGLQTSARNCMCKSFAESDLAH